MTTYRVTTHEPNAETYDVEADAIEIDPNNSNRVTFLNENGAAVAQENNTASARPVTD
jgi:hypothetical protein